MTDIPGYHVIHGKGGEVLLYDAENILFYKLGPEGREALQRGIVPPQPSNPSGNSRGMSQDASQSSGNHLALERLVLIVTTECNLRCRYCYAGGGNYGMRPQPMSSAVALQTVRWAQANFAAIGTIQFFGGEPSLNSKVIRTVCEAFQESPMQARPQYGIITNGVYLPHDLQQTIRQYGFRVTYSMDGPAEVHDLHRVRADGRGSFDTLQRNLARLRAEGIEVGTEMTFTPQATEMGYGVWELADFSVNVMGLREPHIVPVCNEPGSPIQWDERNVGKLVESYRSATVTAFCSFLGSDPVTFTPFSGILRTLASRRGRNVICPAGIATLAVDPEGDIYPCFMFAGQTEYRLGNVMDEDQDRFWSALQHFVHFTYKDTHAECRTCWARQLCTGCMGNIQTTSGSLQGTWQAMCQVMKAITEEVMVSLSSIRDDASLWQQFVSRYKQFRLDTLYC